MNPPDRMSGVMPLLDALEPRLMLSADLIAYGISVPDTTVDPGQIVQVSWTAENQGDEPCGSSQQGVMWSTDPSISAGSDRLLETDYLPPMDPESQRHEWCVVTIPADADPGRTYYIGVIMDYYDDVDEGWFGGEWNNDDAPPMAVTVNPLDVWVEVSDEEISEGDDGTRNVVFDVTVRVMGHAERALWAEYSCTTVDGSARAWEDYIPVRETGTLLFPTPGEWLHFSIPVAVKGDRVFEPHETFFLDVDVRLRDEFGNYSPTVGDRGQCIIRNDDPRPSIFIDDVTQFERDFGTRDFDFTVSLSNPSSETVWVDYRTVDDTATSPSDYSAVSGPLTFSPGQTTGIIPVPVKGDTVYESDERFFVELSGAVNATVSDSTGVGEIRDDDPPPMLILEVSDEEVVEGNGDDRDVVFDITVILRGASDQRLDVELDYTTADGLARANEDYWPVSGRRTYQIPPIPPGGSYVVGTSVHVGVIGDEVFEPDEVFFLDATVSLRDGFQNLATVGDRGQCTIINDDPPMAERWIGQDGDAWGDAENWEYGIVPGPPTAAIFEGPEPCDVYLDGDQDVNGVEFRSAGWWIDEGWGIGSLGVGAAGIDSLAVGTNTVTLTTVALKDDSRWTVAQTGSRLIINSGLNGYDYALTKGGLGTLCIIQAGDLGGLNVLGGSVQLFGGLDVLGGTAAVLNSGAGVIVTESLWIEAADSLLDLMSGDLIVDYAEAGPSLLPDIMAWLAAGLNLPSGYWDGFGLTSSAATSHPQGLTAVGVIDNSDPNVKIGGLTEFAGVPVDETSVLAAYTWWGDANLDGVVDSNDYDMIDTAWLLWKNEGRVPEGGFRWAVGDFNYDGTINSNDYDKIDNAWILSQGAPVAAGAPAPASEPGATVWGMDAVLLAGEIGLGEDGVVENRTAPGSDPTTDRAALAGQPTVMVAASRPTTEGDEPFAEQHRSAATTTRTGAADRAAARADLGIDSDLADLLSLPALDVLGVP